jgi:phosphopantetheinyl transferase
VSISTNSILNFDDGSIHIRLMALVLPENWKNDLLDQELLKLESIMHPQRQLEFICARVLRTHLFGKIELTYNEHGAPIIASNFLSISHSSEYVAFAFSSVEKTAIDIDFVRPNIQKILPKFIHESEKPWVKKDDLLIQMKLWSMKEALYKHYQKRGIIFAEQLIILPLENDRFLGQIFGVAQPYQIKLKSKMHPKLNNLIISYTFDKIYYSEK